MMQLVLLTILTTSSVMGFVPMLHQSGGTPNGCQRSSQRRQQSLLVGNLRASAANSSDLSVTAASTSSSFAQRHYPQQVRESDCPPGYYLDSVENSCHKLGPIGTLSQKVETSTGPFRRAYQAISNLFGMDAQRLSTLGVGFALSYAILSTINGSVTLSAAWYLSSKRTGVSPMTSPKSLLAAYGTLYAFVQLLKPFRVAAAIAMSKLSREFLEQTQEHLHCSRTTAIAVQYGMGWVAWLAMTSVGISIASASTGVPIFQRVAAVPVV